MYQKISKNKNTYKIPPIWVVFFIISIWCFFIQYDIITDSNGERSWAVRSRVQIWSVSHHNIPDQGRGVVGYIKYEKPKD